jgi:BirA family biotin operon repressor/biotin-[acetyl-CoA-carboxylase] ligase
METLFIGQQRFDAAVSPSTNSWALNALRDQKVQEGALFTALEQTSGRGQRGNSWESSPGQNLTISIVLHPTWLKPTEQFYLSQLISLAVTATVAAFLPPELEPEIRIKWPNDIFFGNKKIGGILIENIIRDEEIAAAVAGIGLNVNQMVFENAPNALSLQQITGNSVNIETCLSTLCEQIEWRYLKLKTGKIKELKEKYLEKLLGLDNLRTYRINEEDVTAILRGVTDSGLLILELPDGRKRTFDLKELKFVF